jgi:hypothetical protein
MFCNYHVSPPREATHERYLNLPRAELHHIKPTYRPIHVHLAITQITSPGRLQCVEEFNNNMFSYNLRCKLAVKLMQWEAATYGFISTPRLISIINHNYR